MDDASNEWIKSIMRRLDSMVRWRGLCVAYIGQELRAFEEYLTFEWFLLLLRSYHTMRPFGTQPMKNCLRKQFSVLLTLVRKNSVLLLTVLVNCYKT